MEIKTFISSDLKCLCMVVGYISTDTGTHFKW